MVSWKYLSGMRYVPNQVERKYVTHYTKHPGCHICDTCHLYFGRHCGTMLLAGSLQLALTAVTC